MHNKGKNSTIRICLSSNRTINDTSLFVNVRLEIIKLMLRVLRLLNKCSSVQPSKGFLAVHNTQIRNEL